MLPELAHSLQRLALTALLVLPVGRGLTDGGETVGPFKVTVQDEKPVVLEPMLPVDPLVRIQVMPQPGMGVRFTINDQTLHLGYIYTTFKIDDRLMYAGNPPGRMEVTNARLPRTSGGRERHGHYSIYTVENLRITQTIEVVPTKSTNQKKRQLNAGLVRYLIENKDNKVHRVGVRVAMDTFVVTNDGAIFAAPNRPGQLLDGIEMKGKDVPDYLMNLQVPNLQNPGFVVYQTYALGHRLERPNRIVLTRLGAQQPDGWNWFANPAGGDSAMAMFWDSIEIKPGGKREVAYAFGGGIATNPQGEGLMETHLSGSLQPGKQFTIHTYVTDPAPGQNLTLQLPEGMELVEGRATQPVPPMNDEGMSLIQWRARVRRPGQFRLGIQSSTGVTQVKLVTVSK